MICSKPDRVPAIAGEFKTGPPPIGNRFRDFDFDSDAGLADGASFPGACDGRVTGRVKAAYERVLPMVAVLPELRRRNRASDGYMPAARVPCRRV
jgi:hypothetical protein